MSTEEKLISNHNPYHNPYIGFTDRDIGSHVQFLGSIGKTLEAGISRGMNGIQFFMGNPRSSWKRSKITSKDIEETLKLCQRFPTHIFSHFPYTSNLAGSVKSLAWKDDTKTSGRVARILKSLKYELGVLGNFRRSGVVIHPGNYPDRKKGLSTIASSINRLCPFILAHRNSSKIRLILENSAGAGSSLATTFREIQEIIDQVDERIRGNIGVCIDTAHIWGYGEYRISEIKEIDRMLADLDRIIGIKRLSLFHLNDSSVKFGSRKDRHAPISQGEIWGDNISSLLYLLRRSRDLQIPMILETVVTDMLFISSLPK